MASSAYISTTVAITIVCAIDISCQINQFQVKDVQGSNLVGGGKENEEKLVRPKKGRSFHIILIQALRQGKNKNTKN
jgi:hypothetical protein